MNGHNLKKFFSYLFSLVLILTSAYLPLKSGNVYAAAGTTEISSVDTVIQNPIITGNEFTITYTVNCFTNKTTASELKNISIQQALPDNITYNSITASQAGVIKPGLIAGTPAFGAGSTGQKVIKINLNTITVPASTDAGGTTTPYTITVKFKAGDIGKYDMSEVKYAYDVADSLGKVIDSGKSGSNYASIAGLDIPNPLDRKLKVYPKIKVLYVHGLNEDSEFEDGSMVIHFKKPSSWSTPRMYYYDDSHILTGPIWDDAPLMNDDGGGWYSYKIPKNWRNVDTKVMFYNSVNSGQKMPWTGIPASKDKETYISSTGVKSEGVALKDTDPRLDIDSMSIESFVSHTLMDINGNYDVVYFGKGVYIGKDDDRNTGKAIANYDSSSSKFLPGSKITGAPNYVLSNQTISSWDITERMAKKVQDFIDTKQPVVFNNDVFASGTIFNAKFGSLSFQDSTDIENGYVSGSANVWKVASIDSNTLVRMFARIGEHKPYMQVLASPDKTKCYSWADSTNVVNYKVKCVNFNNDNPIAVTLCFDKNGDGVYSYNPYTGTANGEAVQVSRGLSGSEQTISFPMPSEYMGGQYWKLVAEDGTEQKSEASDYFIYKGDKDTAQININVLQIMPTNNGSSLKPLFDKTDTEKRIDGTTPDNSATGGTIGYWPGVFKITINAVTASDFQNNAGSCRTNLDSGKYDMLIFGFGDSYTKGMTFNDTSLTSIKKFIDSKRGVMFVHDTMSGIDGNRELKDAFLKPVGQIFQPTIYAGNFPYPKMTDGKAPGGYYYTDSSVERINTCGSWSCSYTDLMSKMRGIHTDMSTDNTNGVVKQKVSNINAGIITTFPYQLDTLHPSQKAFNGASTLNISQTHIQYYRLNLEEADPWYNMCYDNCTTDPHGALDIDDSANTYYTYSIGNITFSGTGHNTAGYYSAPDELKLFVNTVLKTYAGGNHSPGVQVISPTDNQKVPKAKNTIDFDFRISDYDGDTLHVKTYIAKCPGSTLSDANRDISSLTDADFTPVTINSSDIVIDRNGDGIADSNPDAISATDGMQAQFGDRIIIKDIPKNIDDILPGTFSRNFFLKVEVSDGKKTTTKIVPVVNYDGPMLDITPQTDITASMGADKTVAVAVYAKGTNRIPNSPIDIVSDIKAGIQVFKADGITPVTSGDVTLVPDPALESDPLKKDSVTVSTMVHKLLALDPVTYHPFNVATGLVDDTLLSSPKAQADKDYEIWNYKLNFKKDGIYYVNYSTDYKVSGSDVTQNYTAPSQKTKITVVSKPSLSYIELNPSSLNYQNSNDDGSYPDDTDSPAVKLKIKFQLTAPITSVNDCKVVLKSAKGTSGAINNDFEITKATLVKTGVVVPVPTITGVISDKTISLGTLTTTGNTEFYELTVEVKGKRLSDLNFCDARIAFSEFDYQKLDDASVSQSISLDSPSADDLEHLPSLYSAGLDNSKVFTVYKVLNDQ